MSKQAASSISSDHGLAAAAAALGVDTAVGTPAEPDAYHYIRLAGAIIGRTDALAMVFSSSGVQQSGVRPAW